VEHFADLDAAIEQLFAGGLNVGDDQYIPGRSRVPPA